MLNIKRILCPVDFSDCSDQAVQVALDAAKRFGASIELLHVMQTTAQIVPLMPIGGPPIDFMQGLSERMKQQLDQLREKVAKDHTQVTTCLREGIVHSLVIDRAQQIEADLIVIGTHGHTGVTHVLLGSVAERVVRLSPVPVLTVGPGQWGSSVPVDGPRKVLCPVDFSAPSLTALDYAATFAKATQATLHILHVVPLLAYALASKEPIDSPSFEAHVRKEVADKLAAMQAKYAADGLTVTTSTVDGVPFEGVRQVAEREAATLIVIGTHGHTGFDRFLLGSVAEKVVRTARIPVLTVRTPNR